MTGRLTRHGALQVCCAVSMMPWDSASTAAWAIGADELTGHADGETMTLPWYLNMTNSAPESQDGRHGQIYSETAFMVEFDGIAGNGQA